MKKITDSTVELYSCIEITGRWLQIVTNMERSMSYPYFKDIPDKKEGVKQLTDFLRAVTAASDLVDCMLVNCERGCKCRNKLRHDIPRFSILYRGQLFF